MPEATLVPTTTRRRLLADGGLAAVGAIAAPPSLADPPDPHPAWLAEWEVLRAHLRGPVSLTVPSLEHLAEYQRFVALEEAIGDTPAATLAGVAAQVRMCALFLDAYGDPCEEGEAAIRNAAATLDRLAGRA